MAKSVLIVDDSPSIRSIIKVFLMGPELELVEAASADRALQLLRLMPISLVVADVNMPGTDGLEFVKKVRADADPRIKNLPVVLLSGEQAADLEARSRAAGANELLRKPVDAAALRASIQRHLGSGG